MPASRPVWKGQIRLSLVSIPVEMYSASKSGARIAFRQIHEPSGKPVHYQKVVSGIGEIDTDDIRKGFEYEKGNFVLLTEDEIDSVKLETKKTLELTQFVEPSEIDPLYFDKSYYLVPQDELAEDAFRVLRDALRSTKKIGIGQMALRGQEYIAAIKPCGSGLLLETLHYADEVRKSDPYFSDISKSKADAELVEVAEALIEKKTSAFDPDKFKDHYRSALREVIDRKLKSRGKKTVEADDVEPESAGGKSNVIDLMSALKASLSGKAAPKSAEDDAPETGKRKPATRKKSATTATKSGTSTSKSKSAAKKRTTTASTARKKAS